MIPRRLLAPAPGWTVETDVVVIGSGIAGLVTALAVAGRPSRVGAPRPSDPRVVLVTKALLDAGSTRWAQGGIAAALAPGDSPDDHLADTLTAGVGLCDVEAVRTLVTEGPDAVRRLIDIGTAFDRDAGGDLALTREGGHHRRRIAHAGGDATGAEISRALLAARKEAGIEVIEHALVLDLLLAPSGEAAGVTLHVMGEGRRDGVGAVRAQAVVLATGGLGQVFSATTNPDVSTGDGVALALRAGAEVTDLEFVQFHPTVLYLGEGAQGQQPLISEAVRGEGAHLIDASGERFMLGRHELAELAPRDVVAKGIMSRMQETGASHVYLDGRHLGAHTWERRFPTILAKCRDHGIDPITQPIPVVPAAHYASGGVRTDAYGRTSVPGLYACGEVACTGVHGANRLASNSLLEGLVFGERIATAITAEATAPQPITAPTHQPPTTTAPAATGSGESGSEDSGDVARRSVTSPLVAGGGDVARGSAITPEVVGGVPGAGGGGDADRGAAITSVATGGVPGAEGSGDIARRSVTSPTVGGGVTGVPGGDDVARRSAITPEIAGGDSGAEGRGDVGRGSGVSPGSAGGVSGAKGGGDLARGSVSVVGTGRPGGGVEGSLVVQEGGLLEAGVRGDVQRVMTAYAGVLRSAEGLDVAARELARLGERRCAEPCVEAWEATNLHTVASAIVAAARMRRETRGSHWREDHPGADEAWLGHLVTRWADGGRLATGYEPLHRAEAESAERGEAVGTSGSDRAAEVTKSDEASEERS
ncbi:L-aspartate oxidase [Thermomonospora umbrina]|uniref:L-aspartate oxidase n=1 Tax=Thermomonospora umbrina TaxID=111806 RepID=A0A3D9SZE9_9ACTN|nr:L-aspartate oxidase [Thermomonospora umbrina]REE97954.1 L-aspartate oxidase [Thermomonospora umbrina]